MGPRLSTLNARFKSRRRSNMEHKQTNSTNDGKISTNNNDQNAESCANESLKNDENLQHFESIYNSSSEQSVDDGSKRRNGSVAETGSNLMSECESTAKSSTLRVQTENCNVPKSNTKLSKKRNKKKRNQWVLKFNCARLKNGNSNNGGSESEIPDKDQRGDCVCTGYQRVEGISLKTDVTPSDSIAVVSQHNDETKKRHSDTHEASNDFGASTSAAVEPVIDLSKFNPDDYPIEDCDERARLERAREIAEGVDPPPGFCPKQVELVPQSDMNIDSLKALFQSALSLSALSQIDVPKSVHTQIDYIHCLVPDLLNITTSSFYWGKMDRYEAETLLDNKPEGTFLLRDSAQEEYLFSVSFRKYERSLHARIEQWNHNFSFDSHDPGVFAAPTICSLIEHYKDPSCCMFFEPVLTIPLHRNFPFSLQQLCRAVICDHLTYDSITLLKLPKTLKTYLKEYHYKQRVRIRKLDSEL